MITPFKISSLYSKPLNSRTLVLYPIDANAELQLSRTCSLHQSTPTFMGSFHPLEELFTDLCSRRLLYCASVWGHEDKPRVLLFIHVDLYTWYLVSSPTILKLELKKVQHRFLRVVWTSLGCRFSVALLDEATPFLSLSTLETRIWFFILPFIVTSDTITTLPIISWGG